MRRCRAATNSTGRGGGGGELGWQRWGRWRALLAKVAAAASLGWELRLGGGGGWGESDSGHRDGCEFGVRGRGREEP